MRLDCSVFLEELACPQVCRIEILLNLHFAAVLIQSAQSIISFFLGPGKMYVVIKEHK